MEVHASLDLRLIRADGSVTRIVEEASDHAGDNPRFEKREGDRVIKIVVDAVLDRIGGVDVNAPKFELTEVPPGTIVVIGHPGNGVTARRGSNGKWFYTHTLTEVHVDDLRIASKPVYIPQERL